MRPLGLALLLVLGLAQNIYIYPDPNSTETNIDSRVCPPVCEFCQIRTGQCQECIAPYYTKDLGSCTLDSQLYKRQTFVYELMNGGFSLSQAWQANTTTTQSCNFTFGENQFQNPVVIVKPINRGGSLNYFKTIHGHRYIVIKTVVIAQNWDASSKLNISVRNNNGIELAKTTLTYYQNPNFVEHLCTATDSETRISVKFQITDSASTSITISYIGQLAEPANYGVAGMFVLIGQCHISCRTCYHSANEDQCDQCERFLSKDNLGYCNLCNDGFRLANDKSGCVKCPIQYETCGTVSKCFYNDTLNNELNQANCQFNENSSYNSEYFINSDQFQGSLFTVESRPIIYQCSTLSIVGLASKNQPITRIFNQLKPHIALSLTFNLFKVDEEQGLESIQYNFVVLVDNRPEFITTLPFEGRSSTCGNNSRAQIFRTFPATPFFSHTRTNNVNITILSSEAENWGIRNFRLAYKTCDDSCQECSPQGCKTCAKSLSLVNSVCIKCPLGFQVQMINGQNECLSCSPNCLECDLTYVNNSYTTKCRKCNQAYYIYENECERLPNVFPPTVYEENGNISDKCVQAIQSAAATANRIKNFTYSDNGRLNIRLSIPENHFKNYLSFYLLKLDNWGANDQLNLYMNDLLVLSKKYGAFGNKICSKSDQNDVLSFEQIEMVDNNNTITLAFQVIRGNTIVDAQRFAVGNLELYGVGCEQCESYAFNYKVEYNYDEMLNIQLIFNRIYFTSDVQQFKKNFILLINNQTYPYDILFNNSIRYILRANHVENQTINGYIRVVCRYPQKVITEINSTITPNPLFRLTQQSNNNMKYLDQNQANGQLQRFTPIEQAQSAQRIRLLFQVVSRMVIYLGLASFFFGCMVPCTHFMHNLQKLWLHIYLASLAMPPLLKFALLGFREVQNQNIAINPSAWQVGIPSQTYYQAPARFQDYHQDITFFRNIYNVGVAFLIVIVWYIVMHVIFSNTKLFQNYGDKLIIRHFRVTFYRRPFFCFNQLIFYQYITVCIACTLQFIDLSNGTNYQTFNTLNSIATIIAFIFVTVYPLASFFYLHQKSKDPYKVPEYNMIYTNLYYQIFYRFINPNSINSVSANNGHLNAINFGQRFYNLFRFGQIWFMALVIALGYNSAFVQLFILLLLNAFHLIFFLFSSLHYRVPFYTFKTLELAFFVVLQIMLLVADTQVDTLTTGSYYTVAVIGIILVLLIILISLLRTIYTAYRIYQQYNLQNPQEFDKANYKELIDFRIRNDDYFEIAGSSIVESKQEDA